MRVVAMLQTYNEERFIAACLEHLFRNGVEVYLVDNESTDRTVEIARGYVNQGLIGIETLPRDGVFRLQVQMRRKEELASELDADWFMHIDTDEIYLPNRSNLTLAEALAEQDALGHNAVNFVQFVFIPTRESPDHDHPNFQDTMRWYYPFIPFFPHAIRAWKRQETHVFLEWSGGHRVWFPELRLSPTSFKYRHYLLLSREHAIQKFVNKRYDPESPEGKDWRARLTVDAIRFPPESEMRVYLGDDQLDASNPRTKHYLGEVVEEVQSADP
jgi:glycosyltransferase involved in cell wall biosynthesis